jgi:hypothetical protein
MADNIYGIRPSIYASTDIFKAIQEKEDEQKGSGKKGKGKGKKVKGIEREAGNGEAASQCMSTRQGMATGQSMMTGQREGTSNRHRPPEVTFTSAFGGLYQESGIGSGDESPWADIMGH